MRRATRICATLAALGLGGLGALGGCDWTTFDTLQKETWAQSTKSPAIGSMSYAVALAPGAASQASGGTLGVLGDISPTYSTIVYDSKGNSTSGDALDHLSLESIGSFTTPPILVADGSGDLAIVAVSTSSGVVAIRSGAAGALGNATFTAASPPDAATYAGTTLVVAAGTAVATLAPGSAAPTMCSITIANVPVSFAALGANATTVFGWSKGGELVAIPLTSLASCASTAAGTAIVSTSLGSATFAPGDGSSLFVLGSGGAEILVAVGQAAGSTKGLVSTVPVAAPTQSNSMETDGVAAAALGTLGSTGDTYLALGFPTRTVEGAIAGSVELHQIVPSTGTLSATADETLAPAQPSTNQQYGRALAIFPYNGVNVLAVAANNEVLTYFRTQLYPDTRQ